MNSASTVEMKRNDAKAQRREEKLCWPSLQQARGAPNPNGIVSSSPGLRGTSYPGWLSTMVTTPTGLRPTISAETQPRWGCSRSVGFPRVARAAQPWAGGRNPFGILRVAFIALVLIAQCLATSLLAKEIHSNGLGGGRWSDVSTWKGGAVPTAEDEAVISARDTVVFDREDTDKPTCKQLLLDANSNLAFQSGQGRRVLSVDGMVEAYGSIKMHAPGLADSMELRLISKEPVERVFKLQRGGSLFLVGRANLPEGKRNVAIVSPIAPGEKNPPPADLTAVARTMVDLQHAQFDNVHVSLTGIDNTGDKPNERCNVIGNRFTAFGRLSVANCDTPAIVKNEFRAQKAAMVRPSALSVSVCQLADIRENHIYGAYAIGIAVSAGECSVSGNVIEDCPTGVSWHTGNAMLKQNVFRNCHTGMSLRTLTGSAEDTLIDHSVTAVSLASAKVQLTSITVTNAVTNKVLHLVASSLTMLNCNIPPEQVALTPSSAKPKIVRGEEPLEALEFLVVRVKGEFPRNTHVEVVTTNLEKPLAPGASDLNIRNSPAPLRADGFTPLPHTLTPLVVKSWRMQEDGVVVPTPEYTLSVWTLTTQFPGAMKSTADLKLDAEYYLAESAKAAKAVTDARAAADKLAAKAVADQAAAEAAWTAAKTAAEQAAAALATAQKLAADDKLAAEKAATHSAEMAKAVITAHGAVVKIFPKDVEARAAAEAAWTKARGVAATAAADLVTAQKTSAASKLAADKAVAELTAKTKAVADARTAADKLAAKFTAEKAAAEANVKLAQAVATKAAAQPTDLPKVLKTLKLTPSHIWHRPQPNAPEPTIEVQLP